MSERNLSGRFLIVIEFIRYEIQVFILCFLEDTAGQQEVGNGNPKINSQASYWNTLGKNSIEKFLGGV